MFQLPENKPVVREATNNIKMILFGEPMSGKTSLASTFPNALFINTDGNISKIKNPVVPLTFIKDPMKTTAQNHKEGWLKFKSMLVPLMMDEQYDTIVIDLLSDLYNLCRYWYFDVKGINDESEIPHGKGWAEIGAEFLRAMKPLMSHPTKNVILITHTKDFMDEATGVVNSIPDIRKAIFNELCKSSTAYMYLSAVKTKDGLVRFLNTYDPAKSSMNRWGLYEPVMASYDDLIKAINESDMKGGE